VYGVGYRGVWCVCVCVFGGGDTWAGVRRALMSTTIIFVTKSLASGDTEAHILKSQCQKRPTTVSKETYYSVKRDLQQGTLKPTFSKVSTHRNAAVGVCVSLSLPLWLRGTLRPPFSKVGTQVYFLCKVTTKRTFEGGKFFSEKKCSLF
jgi:hypothetical protein